MSVKHSAVLERLAKWKLTIAAVAAAVALTAGGFLWVMARNPPAPAPPVITSSLVSQRLEAVKELVTVKYLYSNVGKYEAQNSFYGWNIPFTKKSFLLTYDGVIQAGIDLGDATVEVEGTRVTVTLPPPKILAHVIDESSFQVYDESKNIFNQIEIGDYTRFFADEKQKLEDRAVKGGLYEEASAQARTALTSLLRMGGFLGEEYQITFAS